MMNTYMMRIANQMDDGRTKQKPKASVSLLASLALLMAASKLRLVLAMDYYAKLERNEERKFYHTIDVFCCIFAIARKQEKKY